MGINIEKTTNINDENVTLKQLLDKVTALEEDVSTLQSSMTTAQTNIVDINKRVSGIYTYRYSFWPNASNKTFTTQINVNGMSGTSNFGGSSVICLISAHQAAGDYTFASLWLIRFGYSENNMSSTRVSTLSGTSTSDNITFGVNSNGYLTFTTTWGSGCIDASFITNM